MPEETGGMEEHMKVILIEDVKSLGKDLDKKKIQLPTPIKALGTTAVTIKLHPKVSAELKVIVKEA